MLRSRLPRGKGQPWRKYKYIVVNDNMHPDATPKERENIYCAKHKAVFFMGIGGKKALRL